MSRISALPLFSGQAPSGSDIPVSISGVTYRIHPSSIASSGNSGASGGDVYGPNVSVDNRLSLFSGTDGKHIKQSNLAVTDLITGSGSYSNPSWITSLAYSKISGAPSGITGISTPYIAYVETSGNDATAVVGDRAKPYATAEAAFTALGTAIGISNRGSLCLGVGDFYINSAVFVPYALSTNRIQFEGAGMLATSLTVQVSAPAGSQINFVLYAKPASIRLMLNTQGLAGSTPPPSEFGTQGQNAGKIAARIYGFHVIQVQFSGGNGGAGGDATESGFAGGNGGSGGFIYLSLKDCTIYTGSGVFDDISPGLGGDGGNGPGGSGFNGDAGSGYLYLIGCRGDDSPGFGGTSRDVNYFTINLQNLKNVGDGGAEPFNVYLADCWVYETSISNGRLYYQNTNYVSSLSATQGTVDGGNNVLSQGPGY